MPQLLVNYPELSVCVRANTWLTLNPQPSVTSPLDQQILRRPVFVPSSRADYRRLARDPSTIAELTRWSKYPAARA